EELGSRDGRDPCLRPADGAAAGLGADRVAVSGVLDLVGPAAQRASGVGPDLRLPDAPGDRAREVGAQGELSLRQARTQSWVRPRSRPLSATRPQDRVRPILAAQRAGY